MELGGAREKPSRKWHERRMASSWQNFNIFHLNDTCVQSRVNRRGDDEKPQSGLPPYPQHPGATLDSIGGLSAQKHEDFP